ncbi:hypothetical protein [Rhodococcus qingshengii]|uniref:hypothetical protein n=1 Tax=Rhodococcus qingshengii TaxID=334542 RepID=UPI0035DEFCA3
MPQDIYPPEYTTERGRVRALIPDVEQVDFSAQGVPEYIFSDAHIDAFLSVSRGGTTARIKRAAAKGMRAIGNSEGLIQKVIRTEDLQTDGAKLQQAFLTAARDLERDAEQDQEEEDDSYAFAIVDFQPQPADHLPYTLRGFPQHPAARSCGCQTRSCGCGSRSA